MNAVPFNATTYQPIQTAVHDMDARLKILLVLAYSVALFCVHSWAGIALLAALLLAAAVAARLRFGAIARSFVPVGFILFVTLLANSLSADVFAYGPVPQGAAGWFPGIDGLPVLPLAGSFGFAGAGFVRGCYYVLRIVLLLGASLVLTTTSSSTEISQALRSFLKPLAHLGVPVHDIATSLSIALRFIPLTIDEFQQVKAAQTARAASFDRGGLPTRFKAWARLFVPLFIGLFQRADNLALAMDSRCYGLRTPSQLNPPRIDARQLAFFLAALAGCIAIAVIG